MAPMPCAIGTWRPFLLGGCCHPPHATYPDGKAGKRLKVALRAIPIRFCSRRGLPCRSCRQSRGGLLPHPFTLAPPANRPFDWLAATDGPICRRGGFLSVALSLGSPPPAVSRRRFSVEPGLSSRTAFRLLSARPPGRLAVRIKGVARENANEMTEPALLRTVQPSSRGSAATSRRSVSTVERSAIPSTRSGRKCRWNASTTILVKVS